MQNKIVGAMGEAQSIRWITIIALAAIATASLVYIAFIKDRPSDREACIAHYVENKGASLGTAASLCDAAFEADGNYDFAYVTPS